MPGTPLHVSLGELQGRQRGRRSVHARELLAVLGVERYHLRVKDRAEELCKSPDTITRAIARGVRQRSKDRAYRLQLDEVDAALIATTTLLSADNGGTA